VQPLQRTIQLESMPQDSDVTRVPLLGPRSWPSRWRLLFAPDDHTGSPPQPRERDRILIIEDDLLIASQMEAALLESGFDVIGTVATGHDALELAGRQAPDLAVVDIRLAGDRDGVDTAIQLFRAHGVRCIFASAYSDQHARRRAEAAAPIGWLQKPYPMASLIQMVQAAVSELHKKGQS
jgi:two-component system, response regulator PdtaR